MNFQDNLYIEYKNAIIGPNNEKYNLYQYINKIEVFNIDSSGFLIKIYNIKGTEYYTGFGIDNAGYRTTAQGQPSTYIRFETRIKVLDSAGHEVNNQLPCVLKVDDIDNLEQIKFTELSNNINNLNNITQYIYKGNSANEANTISSSYDENQTVEFIAVDKDGKGGDNASIYLLCDDIRNINSTITNYGSRRN